MQVMSVSMFIDPTEAEEETSTYTFTMCNQVVLLHVLLGKLLATYLLTNGENMQFCAFSEKKSCMNTMQAYYLLTSIECSEG